jgi:hypothetical protein
VGDARLVSGSLSTIERPHDRLAKSGILRISGRSSAPADSPSNDLQTLADSYTSNVTNETSVKSGIQIVDSVWDVRSFNNQADFYYVLPEADYWSGASQQGELWTQSSNNQIASITPTVIQTSPSTTQCSVSTTSGVTWSVGGTAGWNQLQGLNAALSGGVSVTNSQTITCPEIFIDNISNPSTGVAQWNSNLQYNDGGEELITFCNQWVWEVPFSKYQSGQKTIELSSQAEAQYLELCSTGCEITTGFTPEIPLLFADTFALQQPVVTSVNPTCVNAGNTFAINGTGLYPSLVTSVLIDGVPLSSSQFTTVSDTQINVVAPEQSGDFLPIVVQTGEGVSNSNVTIEISVIDLCSVATSQH